MRSVSVILLGIFVAGFLAALTFTPRVLSVRREMEISAPPVRVWQVMTDVAAQPAWRKDLKSVALSRGDRSHPEEWVEVLRSGSEIRFETSEFDAPHAWSISFLGQGMRGTWQGIDLPLGKLSSKLVVIESIEIANPLSRVIFAMTRGLDTFVDAYLNGLKERAQSH